jgi:hypothetical protein
MRSPHARQIAFFSSLALAGLAAAASLPAQAAEMATISNSTVAFVDGGIGASDEAAMRKIAKDYPLRMTFSGGKSNEFVADADVKITDAKGNLVLALNDAGPMTDVALPAGDYRIRAEVQGQVETREVKLDGKDARDLYFHWNRVE